MENVHGQIVNLIWKIADDVLRDVFVRGKYRDVILPLVVLGRLDALLEGSKAEVLKIAERQKADSILDEYEFFEATGLTFYNTSKFTLKSIKDNASNDNDILLSNFTDYLNGFSSNVQEVIKNFNYMEVATKLATNDRLLPAIERITDPAINLTDKEVRDTQGNVLPALDNVSMGMLFEELLRRFNEENNEEAGEHFTPRDAIHLLCRLVFEPVSDNLPKIISIYDPACGSGGMLTESHNYLRAQGVADDRIRLSGTEINPETYAICKSDLIIKGVASKGIHLGNTIKENHFAKQTFGYMITNPPYGKSWDIDQAHIYEGKQLLDNRYKLSLANFLGEVEELACTPRTSDGQLLFILEEISKMKSLEQQPQGTRIASIHNGSSLFTGDAGSGESNIRRYLVENDLVDAIIQLPNNIFYNTGIATYVWLLTNKKPTKRQGKVQLIDASQAFEKLRKNQGARNCTISPQYQDAILDAYFACENTKDESSLVVSKVFANDELRYFDVTIERPLRYRSQFKQSIIDSMLFDTKQPEFSKWLYQSYGEQVFVGLKDKRDEIKSYLEENELKLSDKQLDALLDAKNWNDRKSIVDSAQQLQRAVGTDVYMDFAVFSHKVTKCAQEIALPISAKDIKAITLAMSEIDDKAEPLVKKIYKANSSEIKKLLNDYQVPEDRLASYGFFPDGKGHFVQYESDTALKDKEKITCTQDIYEYFLSEVHPYVPDAWINIPNTKIGCEISFNKYFYKPTPLRTLEHNQADLQALELEVSSLLQTLFGKE